ncbi:hypothetical protein V0288_08180 [Pannus brasiliensis CCIBt3594]|uniref:Uncharacterized protein n=1 Tax=Pannus brasiliensis CCIBt3594 TaxID=1427578 RepID=A0AAW9QSY5_9CHRO
MASGTIRAVDRFDDRNTEGRGSDRVCLPPAVRWELPVARERTAPARSHPETYPGNLVPTLPRIPGRDRFFRDRPDLRPRYPPL